MHNQSPSANSLSLYLTKIKWKEPAVNVVNTQFSTKKENNMNLKDITNLLFLTMSELEKVIPEVETLETEYYQTYYKYLFSSTASSAPMREAEARTRIAQDDSEMHQKYLHRKADLRVLINKKEALIEISRNLRVLESNKKGQE